MTTRNKEDENNLILSGLKAGLSAKASSVYVTLLESGAPLSPKSMVAKTKLHRQYVYDALKELRNKRLVTSVGEKRSIKYLATTPDTLLQEAEKSRLEAMDGVGALMRLYDRSPAGVVEVVRGSVAAIESEFQMLRAAKEGDYLDIVGGAGMNFVRLFSGRIKEWEALRKQKKIKLRYIGAGEDVEHNRTKSIIENESRSIAGIGNMVNVCIRPKSVSFNIYEPEIVTVRVKNKEAVASQRALFNVLWETAK